MIASLIGPISVQANQGNQGFQGILPTNKYYGQQGILGLQAPYQGFQGLGGPNTGSMPLAGPQGRYGFIGGGANSLAAGSITVPVTLSNDAGAYSASAAITLGPPIAPTVAMITNGFIANNTSVMGTYGVAVTGVNIATASGYPSTSWNATIQYYQQSNGPTTNAHTLFSAIETSFPFDATITETYARFMVSTLDNVPTYGASGGGISGPTYPTPSPKWTFTVSWTFTGFSYTNSSFTWLPDIHETPYTLGDSGGSLTFNETTAIDYTTYLSITLDGDLNGGYSKAIYFTITAPNIPDTSSANQSFTLNYLYVV
jgi:hypothetical protein